MSIRERMSGNEAVAYAIRQINPDVMAAFPTAYELRMVSVSVLTVNVYRTF